MPILNWHNTRNDFIKEPNEQAINSIQFLFQSQRGRRSADWNFCIWLLILNRVRLVARLLSRRGNFGGHSSSWWVKIAKCIRACATVVSKETKSVFESNAFIFVWKSFFFPCFFFSSFFFPRKQTLVREKRLFRNFYCFHAHAHVRYIHATSHDRASSNSTTQFCERELNKNYDLLAGVWNYYLSRFSISLFVSFVVINFIVNNSINEKNFVI